MCCDAVVWLLYLVKGCRLHLEGGHCRASFHPAAAVQRSQSTMPAIDGSNLAGLQQYGNATSFFDPTNPILPQSVGWAVVVGFGAFFAILTLILVWFDIKFAGHVVVSEYFQTAGRAIKTGLISVDVVSHWTWSITLLQSSTVGYNWGIAGEQGRTFMRVRTDITEPVQP